MITIFAFTAYKLDLIIVSKVSTKNRRTLKKLQENIFSFELIVCTILENMSKVRRNPTWGKFHFGGEHFPKFTPILVA